MSERTSLITDISAFICAVLLAIVGVAGMLAVWSVVVLLATSPIWLPIALLLWIARSLFA